MKVEGIGLPLAIAERRANTRLSKPKLVCRTHRDALIILGEMTLDSSDSRMSQSRKFLWSRLAVVCSSMLADVYTSSIGNSIRWRLSEDQLTTDSFRDLEARNTKINKEQELLQTRTISRNI